MLFDDGVKFCGKTYLFGYVLDKCLNHKLIMFTTVGIYLIDKINTFIRMKIKQITIKES